MMTVTFLKTEAGISAGDQRTVPDGIAKDLVAKGLATAAPFPPADIAPMAPRLADAPRRPMLSLGRKARKG